MPRLVSTETWYCEVCGTSHISKIDAIRCEKEHTMAKEIIKQTYNEYFGYHEPWRITVRTSDGKEVEYEHIEDI